MTFYTLWIPPYDIFTVHIMELRVQQLILLANECNLIITCHLQDAILCTREILAEKYIFFMKCLFFNSEQSDRETKMRRFKKNPGNLL